MTQPASATPRPSPAPSRGLRDRDRAVLDFERDWESHQGGKEAAIRAAFGVSGARYYQILARLLDDPAAAAHDPLVMARLRRRRDERERQRTSRSLGTRGG